MNKLRRETWEAARKSPSHLCTGDALHRSHSIRTKSKFLPPPHHLQLNLHIIRTTLSAKGRSSICLLFNYSTVCLF